MGLPAASGYAVSGRRLARTPFGKPSLPSTCLYLMPIYGSPYPSVTGEARDEHGHSEVLTGITDAEEVYTEQCEATVAAKHLLRSLGIVANYPSDGLLVRKPQSPTCSVRAGSCTRVRTRIPVLQSQACCLIRCFRVLSRET